MSIILLQKKSAAQRKPLCSRLSKYRWHCATRGIVFRPSTYICIEVSKKGQLFFKKSKKFFICQKNGENENEVLYLR
jgi:hypothetical protein